jgi:hypothetical protein
VIPPLLRALRHGRGGGGGVNPIRRVGDAGAGGARGKYGDHGPPGGPRARLRRRQWQRGPPPQGWLGGGGGGGRAEGLQARSSTKGGNKGSREAAARKRMLCGGPPKMLPSRSCDFVYDIRVAPACSPRTTSDRARTPIPCGPWSFRGRRSTSADPNPNAAAASSGCYERVRVCRRARSSSSALILAMWKELKAAAFIEGTGLWMQPRPLLRNSR